MNRTWRFHCTQCSRCCRFEEGFVFLTPGDLKGLSRRLVREEAEVIEKFCRWVPMGGAVQLSLREKNNRDCIFWTDGGCSVYEARPVQCRTYPFWRHIVDEEGGWEREAATCPGIGVGEAWGERKVQALLRARMRSLPVMRKSPTGEGR
ncbi:MAG: YkgJ family cysteine cluster protein [Spirochaetaceae bacterium]|nr:MAG: YkgJ family cysteine cluster protein [Spirochaetaceae bacterium]